MSLIRKNGKTITQSIAEIFADSDNYCEDWGYRLAKYKVLTEEGARALGESYCDLHLSSLEEISETALNAIINEKNIRRLCLSGLTEISDAQAEALSRHLGTLYLYGLTSLSDYQAECLGRHRYGWLTLSNVKVLSDAAADGLSKHDGNLDLSGLTRLESSRGHVRLAKQLSTGDPILRELDLSGLQFLSDPAAKWIRRFDGWIDLSDLRTMSDSVAESLAKHKFKHVILNRRRFSVSAKKILRDAGIDSNW